MLSPITRDIGLPAKHDVTNAWQVPVTQSDSHPWSSPVPVARLAHRRLSAVRSLLNPQVTGTADLEGKNSYYIPPIQTASGRLKVLIITPAGT